MWPPWLTLTPGSIVIAGVPVTCSGIVLARNQFTGCGAHVAFANGAAVAITGLDGVVRNTTLRNPAAANSATIDVTVFSTERLFQASKTIFVGPDAVTCTAYSTTQLLGCTVAAGGTLSNNDPVYNGATNAAATSLLGRLHQDRAAERRRRVDRRHPGAAQPRASLVATSTATCAPTRRPTP